MQETGTLYFRSPFMVIFSIPSDMAMMAGMYMPLRKEKLY